MNQKRSVKLPPEPGSIPDPDHGVGGPAEVLPPDDQVLGQAEAEQGDEEGDD